MRDAGFFPFPTSPTAPGRAEALLDDVILSDVSPRHCAAARPREEQARRSTCRSLIGRNREACPRDRRGRAHEEAGIAGLSVKVETATDPVPPIPTGRPTGRAVHDKRAAPHDGPSVRGEPARARRRRRGTRRDASSCSASASPRGLLFVPNRKRSKKTSRPLAFLCDVLKWNIWAFCLF